MILERVARGMGKRAVTLANPSDWMVSSLTGGTAYSGKAVNEQTAMSLVPVLAASSLVASAVGGVPLKVYDRDRLEARSSRQWRLLHDAPNDEMAADELWELVAHHLLLWGNAFLLKERDEMGLVRGLWPIKPSRMTVGREARSDGKAYRYFTVDGQETRYYEQDILHIRGLSSEGLIGFSVIQQARQQLGNMLSQDEFQGRFWANGSFMGAALLHPGQLSGDAQERLTKQVQRKKGVAEANGIWVFEEDMKVQQLGMPLRDAEFMAQQRFSDMRVAQMFGLVPPHRWGSDDGSLTYSNAELSGTEFVRWTGRRWWGRIEKSLGRDAGLFPAGGRRLFPEFVTEDLMRADVKARFETYAIGIGAKFLLPNEARRKENLPPIDGGDEFPAEPVVEPPVDDEGERVSPVTVVNLRESEAPEIRSALERLVLDMREMPPVINVENRVEVPELAVPSVTVENVMPEQRAADVVVNVQPTPLEVSVEAPVVTVEAPVVTVEAPVTVEVPEGPAPVVNVENVIEAPRRRIDIKRNQNQQITGATVTDA